MTRLRLIAVPLFAGLALAACGDNTVLGDGGVTDDGGTGQDAGPTLFKLQSGMYKVTMDVVVGSDQCMVDPNNAMNPVNGTTLTLTNDGAGNIALGSPAGDPPQASNGASCPQGASSASNAACATATNPQPFNNNMGLLVRDNNVTTEGGNCMLHRHIENLVTLTADNVFDAAYTRKDTNHQGCATVTTDCTTTWTWHFEKQ